MCRGPALQTRRGCCTHRQAKAHHIWCFMQLTGQVLVPHQGRVWVQYEGNATWHMTDCSAQTYMPLAFNAKSMSVMVIVKRWPCSAHMAALCTTGPSQMRSALWASS